MKKLIREKNPINVKFVTNNFPDQVILKHMNKFIKKIVKLIANIAEKLTKMMFHYIIIK